MPTPQQLADALLYPQLSNPPPGVSPQLLGQVLMNPVGTQQWGGGPSMASAQPDFQPGVNTGYGMVSQPFMDLTQQGQNLAMGFVGGTEAPGIRAFHGSPYDFERFSTSNIGTGEGAQAYGHGLYFAGNEGVARSYRDALSPNNNLAIQDALSLITDYKGDFDAAVQANRDMWHDPSSVYAHQVNSILEHWRAHGVGETPPTGRMYEVNIGADPGHFLDWDKPLSEQSQHVQDALGQLNIPNASRPDVTGQSAYFHVQGEGLLERDMIAKMLRDKTASGDTREFPDLQARLMELQHPQAAAAGALQRAGIPGIRYLDAGSRQAGDDLASWQRTLAEMQARGASEYEQGLPKFHISRLQDQVSHNYVVFDDAMIDIIRKYGLAGLMAGGAAGAGAAQPQQ